jgi:hypothetical protein
MLGLDRGEQLWRDPARIRGVLRQAIEMEHGVKILFLHGWHSVPNGVKPTYLAQHGHVVINPALDDEDFVAAVATAQAEFDQHQPDVVVGSSRGGAIAMNIETGLTPLLLLCPAWKNWGNASTIKPKSVILHSRQDEVVQFADSEELLANSGLPDDALIHVGVDHRLADDGTLQAISWMCRLLASSDPLPWLEDMSELPPISLGDDGTAFHERMKSEVIPWIEKSTIPFFRFLKDPATNEYGILEKDRTGVFLRIGSDHFLLTASHDFLSYLESGIYLFMSWDDEENFFIPLATDQTATSDQATFDVATIKLSDANVAKLLKRHTPISLLDVARNSANADGLFLIVGYPRSDTEFLTQNPHEALKA